MTYMTLKINIADAKAQLSYLISQARQGEEVIICNRNEPLTRLMPYAAPVKRKRVFGQLKGAISIHSNYFEPDFSSEELDAMVSRLYHAPDDGSAS